MAKNSQKIVLFVEEGFQNKIRDMISADFTMTFMLELTATVKVTHSDVT